MIPNAPRPQAIIRPEDHDALCKAFLHLKDEADVSLFLDDLLTKQERRMLAERWLVARLLWKGGTYRQIMAEVRTSSTTVARASKWLNYGNGGWRRVLSRMYGNKAESSVSPSPSL